MTYNPIICAIDTTNIPEALQLVRSISPYVGAIKLGLEFFVAHGAEGVKLFDHFNIPVFLDLKFHDIPNTVAKAIEATAGIDTFMMTVHSAGGRTMLQRAVEASAKVAQTTGKKRPYVVGVTVLTSMDQDDLSIIGVKHMIDTQVKRLADLAQSAHLDGVVCSSYEIEMLRRECGDDFLLVVPGIRPEGSAKGDQKRIMTPCEALDKGADYLVIGRPITQAEEPERAAEAIARELGV